MSNSPQELEFLRQEIDAVDRALVQLLARRFRVVDQVLEVKQAKGLPAFIPERVEVVVNQVRKLAEIERFSPDIAERLWRLLIAETIAYEEKHLK
jgi:chorismate mutase-like protein